MDGDGTGGGTGGASHGGILHAHGLVVGIRDGDGEGAVRHEYLAGLVCEDFGDFQLLHLLLDPRSQLPHIDKVAVAAEESGVAELDGKESRIFIERGLWVKGIV